jgi:hypothetical protein
MVYVIQVCRKLSSSRIRILLFESCLQTCMTYTIAECTMNNSWWWSSRILILLLESCLQTCMTYTIAECTVNNSWWWTEKLSETCRVSCQNKFEKLVHLVGFVIRKFVTMHGHMNVKLLWCVPFLPLFRFGWNTNCFVRLYNWLDILQTFIFTIDQSKIQCFFYHQNESVRRPWVLILSAMIHGRG